jgi:hypothetical protein
MIHTAASTPSQKFCTSKWQDKITHEFIHLTHLSGTGKYETRISKLETNTNDQNINDQNINPQFQNAFVLNLEHLDFDIVLDFGFRYSDF